MAKKTSVGDGYSIGAVAKITGLTDHTIRVWERRYKAVVAKRTEGGHRVYSAANVEKLGLLKQLTDNGLSIGGIATKSNSALRKAVHHLEEVSMKAVPDKFLVAVLGERLRLQLLEDPGPLEIVVAGSDSETFTTDLAAQTVDVVILEVTILDADSLKQLKSLQSQGQARCGLIVYNFGRDRDIQRAVRSGHLALRFPVAAADIHATVRNCLAGAPVAKRPAAKHESVEIDPDWQFTGTIPPRRFTQTQLAYLGVISSSIDCECPQNLSQLVSDLTAFEVYSAQCTNRDAEDAALHHYLHRVSAQARELIEIALQKVVDAEGIKL